MKRQRLSLRLEELESRLVPASPIIPYALALVPDSAVTDTALGGNWSDPASWSNGVPGATDNVLIPSGLTEIVDAVVQAVHTIRVDGELDFAPSADTGLTVDTLVVNKHGVFSMGTAAVPIAAGYTANLTFSDNGPIDTAWDPLLFSRGLLSCGTVNIVGQPTTSIVGWSGSHRGDSSLTLSAIPSGWHVGDLLEIEGTSALVNQDEESAITSLSGNTVGFATPLAYDHLPPDPALQVFGADDTRNVVLQSANPADDAGHGQIMFLTTDVNIQYAKFSSLGRTNKLLPVTTPTLDSTGQVIAGSTANPRDRDPVHFLDAGTASAATVNGSLVEDSPGWGWVNQGSYVNFTNDVACGTVGAGFVAENGNELGTFTSCLAMRETGDGTESDSRKDVDIFGNHLAGSTLGDFGHEGVGFWIQGPGVSLINNVSTGAAGEAYSVYTLPTQDPYTGTVPTFQGVSVTDGVLATETGNVAYGSRDGLDVLYHGGRSGRSIIDSFTAWNVSRQGIAILYAGHLTIQNSWVRGYSSSPGVLAYGIHLGIEAMDDLTFTNDRVEYSAIGLHNAPCGHVYVHGGYWNDLKGIDVRMPNSPNGLNLTVDGAITFGTIPGWTQYSIYMDPSTLLLTQQGPTSYTRFPDYFAASQVLLNTPSYVGQLYWNEEAAGYVPFVSGSAPSWTPIALLGLTNLQLWSQYGIAWAGYVAPSDAVQVSGLWGLLGSQASYPTPCSLVSPRFPTSDLNYKLVYLDQSNDRHTETGLTLVSGWNLITRVVNGATVTFFVYGT